MEYLTIQRTRQGWHIKDSISQQGRLYIGYSLTAAIRQHRYNTGTAGKHFTKIFI